MYRFQNTFDKWWFSGQISQMPGRVVPFFGAGLSIDAPTNLPSGFALTEKLVRYLLDEHVAHELLEKISEHKHVLGRSVPRLEHLLSVATKANANAAGLLNVFRNQEPNRNHRVLASYLMQRRAWAITTNFDQCVEAASGFSVPVHVLDSENKRVQVLHGPQDADWGLIKLHGTIEQGADKLAATIENLVPGLAYPMQQILDRVFSNTDFVLVAGYSGSDHFDVNRYFQTKLSRRGFKARLMWLQHGSGSGSRASFPSSTTFSPEPGTRGPDSFQTAFSGVQCYEGSTSELLEVLLGKCQEEYVADQAILPQMSQASRFHSWSEILESLYVPVKADRYRVGASLCSAIGLTGLLDICLAKLQYELESDQEGLLEEAVSLELKGFWKPARQVLRAHERAKGGSVELLLASNLRRSGRPVRALIELVFCSPLKQYLTSIPIWSNLNQENRKKEHLRLGRVQAPSVSAYAASGVFGKRFELVNCVLDLWRLMRQTRLGRARLISFPFRWTVDFLRTSMKGAESHTLSAEEEIEWQAAALRRVSYGEYFKDKQDASWVWRTIEAEMSAPEFYTDDGPLIPGFYINCRTTSMELDRVAKMFDVCLLYADVLVACVQNSFFDRFERRNVVHFFLKLLAGEEWSALYLRRKMYNDVDVFVTLTKVQFERAYSCAAMLESDEINTRLSQAWLSADASLYKFRTWTRQRIYMPSMKKSEMEAMRAYMREGSKGTAGIKSTSDESGQA